jgi:hypothetical protein
VIVVDLGLGRKNYSGCGQKLSARGKGQAGHAFDYVALKFRQRRLFEVVWVPHVDWRLRAQLSRCNNHFFALAEGIERDYVVVMLNLEGNFLRS